MRKNKLTAEQTVALTNWLVSRKVELEKTPTTAADIIPLIQEKLLINPSAAYVMRIARAAEVPLSAVNSTTTRTHKTTIVARALLRLYDRLGEKPDDELVRVANPEI